MSDDAYGLFIRKNSCEILVIKNRIVVNQDFFSSVSKSDRSFSSVKLEI
jgi:hypothetical protein